MKYEIKSDIPGRMRIRYGRYAFDPEYEYAIKDYFEKISVVQKADASYLTGSVLIMYSIGNNGKSGISSNDNNGISSCEAKSELLSAIKSLDIDLLEPLIPGDYEQNQLIDDDFTTKLIGIVGGYLFRTLFLPNPIRKFVTMFRAAKYIRAGIRSLQKANLDVDVLDASAILTSIGQGNYTTASSVMLLLNISELLESYTLEKTKKLLAGSLVENIESIWILADGNRKKIKMADLKKGDIGIINMGMSIPIDGTVKSGDAMVNQAAMTGEPLSIHKKEGDSVFAGTVVEEGNLLVEVRELQDETRISKIVDMISESEKLKAGIHSKAENIANKIVPFSFLLAAGVYIFTKDVSKALSVLMVDYSCAIKLATPISVITAMKEASEHGIIVKGGKYFESLAEADTVVFDKTGTLTEARPQVKKVIPLNDNSREDVLRNAACIEEHFPHSMARAIVSKAKEENLRHDEHHTEVEYIVAHGIATTLYGKKAVIGSRHFIFEDEKIPLSDEDKSIIDNESRGSSVIYLAIDGKLSGFICIDDPLRTQSRHVIYELKKQGIENIVMLTGDSEESAKQIAHELSVDSYKAQVLPEDKAQIVKEMRKKGHKVIMVGDGINDSPALSEADVSVSMKDASDIAREVANVTLLDSDLTKLLTVRIISKRLMKRIRSNFKFIALFNTGLLALGINETLSQLTTAFLHNASTVAVSTTSMKNYLKDDELDNDLHNTEN